MVENSQCWLKDSCNKIDCDKFCMKLYRLDTLYTNSLIPFNLRHQIKLGLDSDLSDKIVFDELSEYLKNIEEHISKGDNLYLYSMITGNGKTSWAIKLVQEYLNKTWYKTNKDCTVLFINVPRYLLSLKDNISEKNDYISHIKNNILDVELVVWDDIATKSATSFEHENMLSIIDSRVLNGKSNIYTSNLNGEELHHFVGDRLFSRIYLESIKFEFKGKDKRGII